jgi:hypothetical protein
MASTTWTLDADDKALQASLKAAGEAYKAASEAAKKAAEDSTKAAEEAANKQAAIAAELSALKTKLEKDQTEATKKEYQDKLAEARKASAEVGKLETKALNDRRKAADAEVAAQKKILAASSETAGSVATWAKQGLEGIQAQVVAAVGLTAVFGAFDAELQKQIANVAKLRGEYDKLNKVGRSGKGFLTADLRTLTQEIGASGGPTSTAQATDIVSSLAAQEDFDPQQIAGAARSVARLTSIEDTAALTDDVKSIREFFDIAGEDLTDLAIETKNLLGSSGKLRQVVMAAGQFQDAGLSEIEAFSTALAVIKSDQSTKTISSLAEKLKNTSGTGAQRLAQVRSESPDLAPNISAILAQSVDASGMVQAAQRRDIVGETLGRSLRGSGETRALYQLSQAEAIQAANEAPSVADINQRAATALFRAELAQSPIRGAVTNALAGAVGAVFPASKEFLTSPIGASFMAFDEGRINSQIRDQSPAFAGGRMDPVSAALGEMSRDLRENTAATRENTARAGFQPLQSITPPIPFQ